MNKPTILLVAQGELFIYYAAWTLESLNRFGYKKVEIIVGTDEEKKFLAKRHPYAKFHLITGSSGKYPAMSFKQFVLPYFFENIGVEDQDSPVVVCDVDVMWKQDPQPLFNRFEGKNWVQKITAIDPSDFELPIEEIPSSYIGMQTVKNYERAFGLDIFPNFWINGGLYMLQANVLTEMMLQFAPKIMRMQANEMLLSDALISLTYAEMGLRPCSDKADIKRLGVENCKTSLKILEFEIAPKPGPTEYTGYQTAKHYYRAQRPEMYKYVVENELDKEGFLQEIIRKKLDPLASRSPVKKMLDGLRFVKAVIRKS